MPDESDSSILWKSNVSNEENGQTSGYGCWTKNNGNPPQSWILIGFSIIFTIHFGVPLFLETPISVKPYTFSHNHGSVKNGSISNIS